MTPIERAAEEAAAAYINAGRDELPHGFTLNLEYMQAAVQAALDSLTANNQWGSLPWASPKADDELQRLNGEA